MKIALIAAFVISFLGIQSSAFATAAEDAAQELAFVAKRTAAAYELFDVQNGYGANSFLRMMQNELGTVSGSLPETQQDVIRDAICGAGNLVETVVQANAKIEALTGEARQIKAVKQSYEKNGLSESIKPYVAFCAKTLDVKELVVEAATFTEAETQFVSDFPTF